jgi:hypothetical protein
VRLVDHHEVDGGAPKGSQELGIGESLGSGEDKITGLLLDLLEG